MKFFGYLFFIILIAAGASYGSLYYGQRHPLATPTPIVSPTPSTLTYTDPSGFSVHYPSELTLSSTTPNFPAPVTHAKGQVFSFPDSYATNTNLVDAAITASSEDGGQTACLTPVPNSSGQTNSQSVTIGAHQWTLSTGGDQGAGQIYGYRAYSMASGTTCYRVFLSTHSSNVEPKSQMPAFDEAHFEQVLTEIVTSFSL